MGRANSLSCAPSPLHQTSLAASLLRQIDRTRARLCRSSQIHNLSSCRTCGTFLFLCCAATGKTVCTLRTDSWELRFHLDPCAYRTFELGRPWPLRPPLIRGCRGPEHRLRRLPHPRRNSMFYMADQGQWYHKERGWRGPAHHHEFYTDHRSGRSHHICIQSYLQLRVRHHCR